LFLFWGGLKKRNFSLYTKNAAPAPSPARELLAAGPNFSIIEFFPRMLIPANRMTIKYLNNGSK
jgi:hypothetical protein